MQHEWYFWSWIIQLHNLIIFKDENKFSKNIKISILEPNFLFSSLKEKVTSLAELKILQLELWPSLVVSYHSCRGIHWKSTKKHKYKHEVNIFEAKQRKITCIWLILINDKSLPGRCRWIRVRWTVEKIRSWFLGAFWGLNLVLFSFLATFWCLVWLIDCQRHLIIAILTSINLSKIEIWHIETSFLWFLRLISIFIIIAWKTCWEKRNAFKIGQ